MKHIIIEDTDKQMFLKRLNDVCSQDYNIINVVYSTNSVQTIEWTEHSAFNRRKEVVKTNYSALIQYT